MDEYQPHSTERIVFSDWQRQEASVGRRVPAKSFLSLVLSTILAWLLTVPPLNAGAEIKVDLLRNGVGVPPLDFHFGQTGGGPDGKWAVIRDSEATQGAALEQ